MGILCSAQTAEKSTLNQLISPHENPAEFSSVNIYKTSAGFMNSAHVFTLCSSYLDLQSFCIPYEFQVTAVGPFSVSLPES